MKFDAQWVNKLTLDLYTAVYTRSRLKEGEYAFVFVSGDGKVSVERSDEGVRAYPLVYPSHILKPYLRREHPSCADDLCRNDTLKNVDESETGGDSGSLLCHHKMFLTEVNLQVADIVTFEKAIRGLK